MINRGSAITTPVIAYEILMAAIWCSFPNKRNLKIKTGMTTNPTTHQFLSNLIQK